MAKRDYLDLYKNDNLFVLNTNHHWQFLEDDEYFYKLLQEQSFLALDGMMALNLEYMMDPQNFIEGINPVSDMYYVDDIFMGYRTRIVDGKNILQLADKWQYDLKKWLPFVESLISTVFEASKKHYCFPDLFTFGNILYRNDINQIKLIDNDGIQIKNRFVGTLDSFAKHFFKEKEQSFDKPIMSKYFNSSDLYFTNEYNLLAIYSWFFMYFFNINLSNLIIESSLKKDSTIEVYEQLKDINFPMNSDLASRIMDLFSLKTSNTIDPNDFSMLADNFLIEDSHNQRVLIPR